MELTEHRGSRKSRPNPQNWRQAKLEFEAIREVFGFIANWPTKMIDKKPKHRAVQVAMQRTTNVGIPLLSLFRIKCTHTLVMSCVNLSIYYLLFTIADDLLLPPMLCNNFSVLQLFFFNFHFENEDSETPCNTKRWQKTTRSFDKLKLHMQCNILQ